MRRSRGRRNCGRYPQGAAGAAVSVRHAGEGSQQGMHEHATCALHGRQKKKMLGDFPGVVFQVCVSLWHRTPPAPQPLSSSGVRTHVSAEAWRPRLCASSPWWHPLLSLSKAKVGGPATRVAARADLTFDAADCSIYSTCTSCAASISCGWCSTTGECVRTTQRNGCAGWAQTFSDCAPPASPLALLRAPATHACPPQVA